MNYNACSVLLSKLDEQGIEAEISKGSSYSHDEPNFPLIGTTIAIRKKYTDGNIKNINPSIGNGFSFNNSGEALFKSICEAMERLCYYCYRRKNIKYGKYKNNTYDFIDTSNFSSKKEIAGQKLGWIKAKNIFNNRKYFVPAQIVYFNYPLIKGEPKLDFPCNSNGGAIGATHEQALLNGLYEVVERDAFMTIYLNKISPPRINLKSLDNKMINMILEKCIRYKLELYVADMTNDIGIPTFLAVLVDRTGLGPAISIGAKSGFRTTKSVIGAIAESFSVRFFIKTMLKMGIIFGSQIEKERNAHAVRAEYWFPLEMLKDINFIISGSDSLRKYENFNGTIKEELDKVLSIFKRFNLNGYYTDITLNEFRKIDFFTYKVIVPALHPLYLKEEEKKSAVNIKRLKEVSRFFGKQYAGVNDIPHPFL